MPVETCHIASRGRKRACAARSSGGRASGGLRAYDQRTGGATCATWWCARARTPAQLLAMLVTAPGAVPGVDGCSAIMPDGVVGVVHAVERRAWPRPRPGWSPCRCSARDGFEERIGGLRLRLSPPARSCRPTP